MSWISIKNHGVCAKKHKRLCGLAGWNENVQEALRIRQQAGPRHDHNSSLLRVYQRRRSATDMIVDVLVSLTGIHVLRRAIGKVPDKHSEDEIKPFSISRTKSPPNQNSHKRKKSSPVKRWVQHPERNVVGAVGVVVGAEAHGGAQDPQHLVVDALGLLPRVPRDLDESVALLFYRFVLIKEKSWSVVCLV